MDHLHTLASFATPWLTTVRVISYHAIPSYTPGVFVVKYHLASTSRGNDVNPRVLPSCSSPLWFNDNLGNVSILCAPKWPYKLHQDNTSSRLGVVKRTQLQNLIQDPAILQISVYTQLQFNDKVISNRYQLWCSPKIQQLIKGEMAMHTENSAASIHVL